MSFTPSALVVLVAFGSTAFGSKMCTCQVPPVTGAEGATSDMLGTKRSIGKTLAMALKLCGTL